MNPTLFWTINGSVLVALCSGGLLGAIYTGRTTKSAIEKNYSEIKKSNSEALETYQKIADAASESERKSLEREREKDKKHDQWTREIQQKHNEIVSRLEAENSLRLAENVQLKHLLVAWSTGIQVLHDQFKEKEMVPRWKPNTDDLSFLNK